MMKCLLAGALALAASNANAQTWKQMQWGLNTATSPYQIGVNLGGTWRQVGTIAVDGTYVPGGLPYFTCAASQWLSGGSSAGVAVCTQPAFSDLSGSVSPSQMPGIFTTRIASDVTDTILQSDCGNAVQYSNASNITVTLPSALTATCAVLIVQTGSGYVSFSPTPSNAHGYLKTYGLNAAVTVMNGLGGSASAWVMFGDAQ